MHSLIFFLNFKITYSIFSKLENIIVYLEKIKFLYFPILFRMAIFLSYYRGYYDRSHVKIKKIIGMNKVSFSGKRLLIVGGTGSFGNQF